MAMYPIISSESLSLTTKRTSRSLSLAEDIKPWVSRGAAIGAASGVTFSAGPKADFVDILVGAGIGGFIGAVVGGLLGGFIHSLNSTTAREHRQLPSYTRWVKVSKGSSEPSQEIHPALIAKRVGKLDLLRDSN